MNEFLNTLFTLTLIIFGASLFAASTSEDTKFPLTKQSAAELIRSKYQSKILAVDEKTDNDDTIFVIKVIDNNGKMGIFTLDAETGHQLQ